MHDKFALKDADVVVIGGGSAGMASARELSAQGRKVILLEKHKRDLEVLKKFASSFKTPNRFALGFHYKDLATAKTSLTNTLEIFSKYPDYLVGQDLSPDEPIRHGRYYIMKDSHAPWEELKPVYEELQALYAKYYAENPEKYHAAFGPPENFFRVLDRSEYETEVNADNIALGIETSEHLFNWVKFAEDAFAAIDSDPNIICMDDSEVSSMQYGQLNEPRFDLTVQKPIYDDEQKVIGKEETHLKIDSIVNATYFDIDKLNDTLGIRQIPHSSTNRAKVLVVIDLPPELRNMNSSFFCMGPYAMFTNDGEGTGYLTCAKLTNLEASSELEISDNMRRLVEGRATPEEQNDFGMEVLHGYSIGLLPEPDIALKKNKIYIKIENGQLEYYIQDDLSGRKKIGTIISSQELGLTDDESMHLDQLSQARLNEILPNISSKAISEGHLAPQGMTHYIPAMKNAKIKEVRCGIVHTDGEMTLDDLNDPKHPWYKRDYSGVTEPAGMGLVNAPGVKLFYFQTVGRLAATYIQNQRAIQSYLDKGFKELVDRLSGFPREILKTLRILIDRSISTGDIVKDPKTEKSSVNAVVIDEHTIDKNMADFYQTALSKNSLDLEIRALKKPTDDSTLIPSQLEEDLSIAVGLGSYEGTEGENSEYETEFDENASVDALDTTHFNIGIDIHDMLRDGFTDNKQAVDHDASSTHSKELYSLSWFRPTIKRSRIVDPMHSHPERPRSAPLIIKDGQMSESTDDTASDNSSYLGSSPGSAVHTLERLVSYPSWRQESKPQSKQSSIADTFLSFWSQDKRSSHAKAAAMDGHVSKGRPPVYKPFK